MIYYSVVVAPLVGRMLTHYKNDEHAFRCERRRMYEGKPRTKTENKRPGYGVKRRSTCNLDGKSGILLRMLPDSKLKRLKLKLTGNLHYVS